MKVIKRLIWKLITLITSPATNTSKLNEESLSPAAESAESSSIRLSVSMVMVEFEPSA